MVYKNFEELNNAYEHERSVDMSFKEEESYVKDCFDTYEAVGFTDTWQSPYSEESYGKYNGMKFTVDGRASYIKEDGSNIDAADADLECLPMWHVTLENGEKILACPEDICIAEHNTDPMHATA